MNIKELLVQADLQNDVYAVDDDGYTVTIELRGRQYAVDKHDLINTLHKIASLSDNLSHNSKLLMLYEGVDI